MVGRLGWGNILIFFLIQKTDSNHCIGLEINCRPFNFGFNVSHRNSKLEKKLFDM
jgi:hypothetical protein